MRVLLLCQLLPHPPHSGAKLKTWNLIQWLGARHEVTLVAFARDEPAAALQTLRRHCAAVHTVPMVRGRLRDAAALVAATWSGRPWIIARDRRPAMHALLQDLCAAQRFDLVHIDQLNMAQYADHARGAFTVLDAHNALWALSQRLATTARSSLQRRLWAREARALRSYEGAAGRAADAVLAVSAVDRRALRAVIGDQPPITVVPIGIDPDEWRPLRRSPAAARVVYIGTMFWPPNVDAVAWFLRAVWPRIRAAHPSAGLDLIGARPPRALRALAAAAGGVRVTGYVRDPTPLLTQAAAVVAPLLAGSGMRVKILTALAQALPVVTTSVGCEGIDAAPGRELLIADTAEAFAAATGRLLDDRALGDQLGGAGRRLIEQRYDYRRTLAGLESVYRRAGAAP